MFAIIRHYHKFSTNTIGRDDFYLNTTTMNNLNLITTIISGGDMIVLKMDTLVVTYVILYHVSLFVMIDFDTQTSYIHCDYNARQVFGRKFGC